MLKTFSRIELMSENNLFKLCVCWMKGMWTRAISRTSDLYCWLVGKCVTVKGIQTK